MKGITNMTDEVSMSEVISEIKNADEDSIKKVIEEWFEYTRTSGMKIGASYISAAIYGIIQKHIYKQEKTSLRDYKRCIASIIDVINKQLQTQQNETKDAEVQSDNNAEETL